MTMKDLLTGHEPLIEKLNLLMQKLSNQIPATKIRMLTHLKACMCNDTRWSFILLMLERFFKIKDFIIELGQHEIDTPYPEEKMDDELERLLAQLSNLESFTTALLDDSVTLDEAWGLFDAVFSGTS